ncbi:MAG TPA: polysaccharide deacetylase family protein [Methylomirabilota bacterium]|nr:polysaccharide deacetylase family protein [Methylomirabilota bacterium]
MTPSGPKAAGTLEVFESKDFIVATARSGDTPETLAARHLGDARKAWMIEDYTGVRMFAQGQEVVIPKREWNPVGVFPWGYQLVPVLVYHNMGPEDRGRLVIGVKKFEAQMKALRAEGFQSVSISDYLEFTAGRKQLARKSVLITFDDGYRSFIQYARPILKDYGFTATLFVYSDFVGGGGMSWKELSAMIAQGFDVQAHSKTHSSLRRKEGEPQEAYAKRIEAELAYPAEQFRKQLGRASDVLAYPYGDTDDELLPFVVKYGYVAAFTVRRQSNPAWAYPLKISRSQVYSEMALKDFTANLTNFQDEEVGAARGADGKPAGAAPAKPASTTAAAAPAQWSRDALAAAHNDRADQLEQQGRLRQALEERLVALTINPRDRKALDAQKRLEGRITQESAALVQEAKALLGRGLVGEAQQRLLVALSLDPTNRPAFESLQNDVREVMSIVHTVRAGDTCPALAELYYGDRLRCEVIAETNRLALNVPLRPGQKLKIPEIPGVPFQLR